MSDIYCYRHGGMAGDTIDPATPRELSHIAKHISELTQVDVYCFSEYWEEFHPDELDVINFLNTKNIVKCGTIDSIGLDVFYVDPK